MLARAVGRDRKGKLSPFISVTGIALSFIDARLAVAVYAGSALLWLIPDRRLERTLAARAEGPGVTD